MLNPIKTILPDEMFELLKKRDAWTIKANLKSGFKIFFKEIRFHHQVKNVLIFVPLILGHYYADLSKDFYLIVAFIAFFFITSSVYLLNDIKDLETDRQHHSKRNRPLAAGSFPLGWAFVASPLFLLIGLSLALLLSGWFFLSVVAYYICTLLYSFWLKRLALIDVFMLAFLYTLRILAGGTAALIPISPWLLSFSLFFFLGLAYVKRYVELLNLQTLAISETRDKSYFTKTDTISTMCLGIASNYVSVLILALYVNSSSVQVLYKYPHTLWLAVILILYFINKLWFMAARGDVNEDPLMFLLKDKLFLCASILVGSAIVFSNYLNFY